MSDNILSVPPVAADKRIGYGPEPDQYFDLYAARHNASQAPVLLNIHGGFWRAKYDLTHASHLCSALAARGWNVANLEYRRVGSPGGGWPRTFQDIRNAYRYLVQHSRDLGIPAVPAIAMGHSAGGQLALCLAARERLTGGCMSLAGALDLRRVWELHLSNDAVVEYLGGTPEQVPDHYREASPAERTISIPQAIIHGTRDDIVPIGISASYVAAKSKRGEQIKFVEVSNADHFDLIDPRSKAFGAVIDAIAKLLHAPGISG
jgi:acetyl esterase/lipase